MLDSPVFLSSLSFNFTAGQFRLLYYEAMLLYNRCSVGFNIYHVEMCKSFPEEVSYVRQRTLL